MAVAQEHRWSNCNESFAKALNKAGYVEVWETLFQPSERQRQPTSALSEGAIAYFENVYKSEQILHARKFALQKGWKATDPGICHCHILEMASIMRSQPALSREELLAFVSRQPAFKLFDPTTLAYIRAVTLRVAFLVQSIDDEQTVTSNYIRPQWQNDERLAQFLIRCFPQSDWSPQGREALIRLNTTFTAPFMMSVCGLKIEFTGILSDHLRMSQVGRYKVLRIFPYKSCLVGMLKEDDPLIPKCVIEETLMTLALLFPIWDPATEQELSSHVQKIRFHTHHPIEGERVLNIFRYTVWRDRILELYDDVYLSPPASWAQLRKDRRNPQQFWTFWIAMVILLLTLISTVATVIQTVATVVYR